MKNILGHKSWTMEELIEILCKNGTYTMPNLPHYRYSRVQNNCLMLKKSGLIEKAGKTNNGINFRPTELFKLWQKEHTDKVTNKMPIKWAKEKKRLITWSIFCLMITPPENMENG